MLAVVDQNEINALPFVGAPEALSKSVISGPAPTATADMAAGGQQGLFEGGAGNWLPWSGLKM